ncbi:MAG TPA: hypothetical protein VJ044_03115, partial [Candidatus Hodarchaeales archaeon]|nr:hypothetical protein [Candidatus Hodarchaeales archaeon]
EKRRQRRQVKYSHLLSELSMKLILKDSQVNNVLLPTSGGWIPHTNIRGFTWSPHQLCELEDQNKRRFLGKIVKKTDSELELAVSKSTESYKSNAEYRIKLALIWLSEDGKEMTRPNIGKDIPEPFLDQFSG